MHFAGFGGPAGFEGLDELGGADHFDAQAADQLDGAAVHHGDVGDGAHGGILHGDLFHAGGEFPEGVDLLGPTGVGDAVAGEFAEGVALDAVLHAARFAGGGDHVIPAAGGRSGGEAEDAVGEGVALVVIEEEPAVEGLGAEFGLDFFEVHG